MLRRIHSVKIVHSLNAHTQKAYGTTCLEIYIHTQHTLTTTNHQTTHNTHTHSLTDTRTNYTEPLNKSSNSPNSVFIFEFDHSALPISNNTKPTFSSHQFPVLRSTDLPPTCELLSIARPPYLRVCVCACVLIISFVCVCGLSGSRRRRHVSVWDSARALSGCATTPHRTRSPIFWTTHRIASTAAATIRSIWWAQRPPTKQWT